MDSNFSVLVVGCKKHQKIASCYFEFAKLYWSASLQNTIFCTDTITDFELRFAPKIVTEKEKSFSNRILTGLNEVKTEIVFLMLDDYFIKKSVDTESIDSLVLYMSKNDIDYCKLIGMPKCFKRNKNYKGTYLINKNTHYGVSLQPSVWKKEALLKALSMSKGNTAWEVEAAFSEYQKSNFEKCITFNKNFLNYENGVLRGKLFPNTNKLLIKNNIKTLDIERISRFKAFCFMSKQHIAMHLPMWFRKFGKRIGKKRGKVYYSLD